MLGWGWGVGGVGRGTAGTGMRVPGQGFRKMGHEAYLCPEDHDRGPLVREKLLMNLHFGNEVLRGYWGWGWGSGAQQGDVTRVWGAAMSGGSP